MCLEFTANGTTTAGGFLIDPNSNFAMPGTFRVGLCGNVGLSDASFTRPSAATWHAYAVQFDMSAASGSECAAVYVDGSSQALTPGTSNENTGNFANSTLNFMCRNGSVTFGAGRLCEVGIYSVLLGTDEITALAKRFSPLLVRPTALECYWPLMGRASPEPELMNSKTATVSGATQTDHPAIIYPVGPKMAAQAKAPVPPEFSPSWATSWVNPAGVAHPADISARQFTMLAIPPFDLLASNAPLQWLGTTQVQAIHSAAWPSAHLVKESVGAPLFIPAIGWFPVGGQRPQSPPVYPPPELTGLAFITPTDYAVFPHVPPSVIPPGLTHRQFNYAVAAALTATAGPVSATFVTPVAPTATCALNLAALKQRVYEQLDDDGTYYTGNEVRHALNAGQNLFALTTLCIERTANFTQTAGQCFHVVSDQISDYLVPLRVTTTGGARIRPATITTLDARSSTWRATAGTPTQYAAHGYDLIAFTPQFASSTAVRLTYAAMPTQLASDIDVPEIPDEQHIHLVDFACWWLRLKEGGQELANASEWLRRFVEAAHKYADFVRRRSYGQRYDTVPFDLASFDRGRLEITLPKTKRTESPRSP